MYVCIYIYIERERERCIHVIYIYIYIYVYTYTHILVYFQLRRVLQNSQAGDRVNMHSLSRVEHVRVLMSLYCVALCIYTPLLNWCNSVHRAHYMQL